MNKALFNLVKTSKPNRNVFDLGHRNKLSLNFGDLVPTLAMEVIPGDTIRVNAENFLRLAPMIAPIMEEIDVHTHFFFIPNYLIWDNFESFISNRTQNVHPYITPDQVASLAGSFMESGTLWDYLGLPSLTDAVVNAGTDIGTRINSLPFRAYQTVCREFYEDQNIPYTDSFDTPDLGDGLDTNAESLLTLRKRAWKKDYFTSALQEALAKPDVIVPLEVDYLDTSLVKTNTGSDAGTNTLIGVSGTAGSMSVNKTINTTVGNAGRIENIDTTSTGVLMDRLRTAMSIQTWLEKMQRGGRRYMEILKSAFGVIGDDRRLDRPKYLGGGRQKIVISDVTNMTSITTEEPLGTLGGRGISYGNARFSETFNEHGWILAITSIMPKKSYMQGIEKKFRKEDIYSYYWRDFANLGEQPIRNDELYYNVDDNEATNSADFGFQSRYAEYKFINDCIHGDFRDSLNFWHAADIYTTRPGLNTSFLQCNPSHRFFAVTDPAIHKAYMSINFDIKALRPIPLFSTPSF